VANTIKIMTATRISTRCIGNLQKGSVFIRLFWSVLWC